ncbi:hypothetical protein [Sphingomonas sp.]|jgi:hypothetical protein|uniref:hypothetical protein n=1 Tax=Sphingomonas sp. TaxID=28214 RepID=UPI002DB7FA62|nr:hypothetical protein [Sphingomonas sp.]HEU4968857.1 hypothetical protein [Sphingomonas sp.]
MRDLLTKVLTGSMIAGAALMVSACGSKEEANNMDTANVTEMNATDMNTTTDNMTAVDAANGTGNMAGDMNDMNASGNMMGNNMSDNMMGNNMSNGN